MNWKNGETENALVRIQVTNQHIYAKGKWVMHVRELDWSVKDIGIPDSATEEEAQIAAVEKVKEHLIKMIESLK